jgi:heterodisulfide reductase subunit A-like polyferredoxin
MASNYQKIFDCQSRASTVRDDTFSSMRNETVLISGAGIAGPTLAFWLKAAGFQPTLVERSSGCFCGSP